MLNIINKITNLDDIAFRNTIGVQLNINHFDDLSDDPLDWQQAEMAADFSNRFSFDELQYNAINYIFSQRTWPSSRFGSGNYAVWYGCLALETTFYETIYHWKRFLADAPSLINANASKPVCNIRTVFSVHCQSALIDLRQQTSKMPALISKGSYTKTQDIGSRLYNQGFPGLLARSARQSSGTNVAVFNQRILNAPQHQGDYLYQIQPKQLTEVEIFDMHSNKLINTI
ncbi:MAG: RES family NAD+ phosphorylase [Coxiellaceae bacterium]|nr:RES family NAD+ phosphorylase [Coxiellaceae bacterium]